MDYPHDEFDDVPEDSAPRGAYRGVAVDPTRSTKKTLAFAIAGVIALIVGGIMFVISPRHSSPEASSTLATATASASASETASAEATSTLTGMVYNSGAYQGAAGQASTVLGNEGYTISQVANWQGVAVYQSTVYYSKGHAEEAEKIAQLIGVSYIAQDNNSDLEFYVVLAYDYAGLPSVTGEEVTVFDLSKTEENTESTDSGSTQTESGVSEETGNQQQGTEQTGIEGQIGYNQQPAAPGNDFQQAPGYNG